MENKGLELAENMTDFVNTYSRDKNKDFIEGFTRQHRTLQQSSFRMILQLIEHMASDEYRTDDRNAGSQKVAKQLLKGFQTEYHNELRAEGMSEKDIKGYVGEDFLPSKFLRLI